MKILYDWRGMPIEFIQTQQPMGSSSSDLFRLTMSYDGSGRRISKTRWVKKVGSQDWEKELVTHYTGIGTEIREDFSKNQTKVVVNMPQGLGRYKVADASQPADDNASRTFEWYLKNHLGSTMLVYGTQADANPAHSDIGTPLAAYDYRAFGEMVELLPPPTGKVTENFTGKEHDDEISLDYFGARYLDPMLGMWISVDPKRQFASPYLYAGNGYNPVNGVDPDGNYVIYESNKVYDPAFRYGFRYHSIVEHVVESIAGLAIFGSGIVACMPPKGEIENSLRSSAAEGVVSIAFDFASLGLTRLAKVAPWGVSAFKFAKVSKLVYDGLQTLK
jgi:RHS repeat-associated protein